MVSKFRSFKTLTMLCLAPRSMIPTFPSVLESLVSKLPAVNAESSPIIFFAFSSKFNNDFLSIFCPTAYILEPLSLKCFVIDLTSNPPLKGISYSFSQEVIEFSDLQEDGVLVKEFPITASTLGLFDS